MRPIDADALKKRLKKALDEWEDNFSRPSSPYRAIITALLAFIDEEPTVFKTRNNAISILHGLCNELIPDAQTDWQTGYSEGIFAAIELVEFVTGVTRENAFKENRG